VKVLLKCKKAESSWLEKKILRGLGDSLLLTDPEILSEWFSDQPTALGIIHFYNEQFSRQLEIKNIPKVFLLFP